MAASRRLAIALLATLVAVHRTTRSPSDPQRIEALWLDNLWATLLRVLATEAGTP